MMITVIDYLPDANLFTYVSSSAGGIYNSITRTITWTGLSLPANTSGTVTISGIVGKAGGPSGTYDIGSYYIMNGSGNQTLSNDASIQNPTMPGPVFLASPESINIGQSCSPSLPPTFTGYIKSSTNSEIFYLVTMTNNGNITDRFTLSTNSPGTSELMNSYVETATGTSLTTTPWLTAGGSYSFIVRMKTRPGTNPATVNYTTLSAISTVCGTTVTSAITTYVYGGSPPAGSTCDMQIAKTSSANPATVGTNFTYTITLVNNSASQKANNVLIIDNLPAGVSLVSYTGSSGVTVSNPSAGQIRAIKSSQKISDDPIVVTITVTPGCTAVPSVTNTAVVSTSTADGTPGNDQVSINTAVNSTLTSPTGSGATVCSGSIATLSASSAVPSPGFKWYTTATGGTSIASGSSYVTPAVTANTNYYVSVYTSGNPSCESARTTVTASVIPEPVITIQPTGQAVCEGTAVSFSTSATGTGLGYQWQQNTGSGFANISNGGVFSDATTPSLTITGTTSAMNTYQYRCVVNSGVCAGINTNTATLTVKTNGTWLGINTNWNDPQNWCGNVAPTIATDVFIPVVVTNNYPVLSATGYCNNITLAATTTLTINNSTLQVAGAIANSGTIYAATATLILNGSAAQAIPANSFASNAIYDLIISNSNGSVTLMGDLSIYGSVTFTGTGKTFFTNDYLTLKSTATNTARVGDLTSNTINGQVTVERYISAKKAWRLLSVPTNTTQTIKAAWQEGAVNGAANPIPNFGTQITSNRSSWSADGFDLYSVNPSMKAFDPVSNDYAGITATNAAFPTFANGYMIFVRGERTATAVNSPVAETVLRTKGPLFSGDQPAINVPADKFAAIPNPFASAIDVRNITKNGLKEFYYLWDSYLSGAYGFGGFQTLSLQGSDYVITPGGGSYGAVGSINNLVSSGHAFFVQANSSGGSITMTEAVKTAGSLQVTTPVTLAGAHLRATMYGVNADSSSYVADGILIDYADDYSNNVDENDAIKSSNTSENLSIKNKSSLLVVERRPTITQADTINLNLSGVRYQAYRFGISAVKLEKPGLKGWLEDNFLKTKTELNLSDMTRIDFTVSSVAASYASNRFRIVFTQSAVLPLPQVRFEAKKSEDGVLTKWVVENQRGLTAYKPERSFDGVHFQEMKFIGSQSGRGEYEWIDKNPHPGNNYYRLQIMYADGSRAYSNITNVPFNDKSSLVEVYPNPVKENLIHLKMVGQPSGMYDYSLLNQMGQKVTEGRKYHSGVSREMILPAGNNLVKGIYTIHLQAPGGASFSLTILKD